MQPDPFARSGNYRSNATRAEALNRYPAIFRYRGRMPTSHGLADARQGFTPTAPWCPCPGAAWLRLAPHCRPMRLRIPPKPLGKVRMLLRIAAKHASDTSRYFKGLRSARCGYPANLGLAAAPRQKRNERIHASPYRPDMCSQAAEQGTNRRSHRPVTAWLQLSSQTGIFRATEIESAR